MPAEIEITPEGQQFLPNRNAVVQYLKDHGYKIGKSKLYQDSDTGRLRTRADGSVLLSDVEIYVKAYLAPKKKAQAEAIERRQLEKTEWEIRKLKAEVMQKEFAQQKEAGAHLPRADVEMELAAKWSILDNRIRFKFHGMAPEIVALAGGNLSRVGEVLEALNTALDEVLTDTASMDFQVIFQK
jgi:hypothetical protein